MHHPAALLVASLALMLSCASATAQWKWRDAGGRITASDLPPPKDVPERDVLARPADTRAATAAKAASAAGPGPGASSVKLGSTGLDPELEARRKRAADEQTAQARQQEARDLALRAENCVRAKGALAGLADGQRMTRTNAKGEREVLDDKERADEMQRARAVIASDCR